ncbi:acid protease [Pholiota conissans]|uniref:Acid protease n=1 Tax=Pholiota conissans TaxID=109636 RepID=A0A9P5Z8B9_9AGAR|nr:acid protease [Pholiota conissans]
MAWSVTFVFGLLSFQVTSAYRFQIYGSSRSTLLEATSLRLSSTPASVKLNNSVDISYYAEISFGNQTFTVLVDTGSSDLWVAGSVINSTFSGHNASIKYAANSVMGPIKYVDVNFAGHQVAKQAFLEIAPDQKSLEGYGILGLGPGSGSFIAHTLSSNGTTLLDRIFYQNSSNPNFFTILLDRDIDPTTSYEGSITLGEVIPEFSSILEQPKLPVTSVPEGESVDQHLQILLDPNGIIGPDGKAISTRTSVEQTENKDQMTVVIDSGFTLPQFPRPIVDGIYSRFRDTEFRDVAGIGAVYVLPCEQEVNVTFLFSGKSYPMHPLDMTLDPSSIQLPALRTSQGQKACIGTFQPFTYGRGSKPNYDIVLGMAFLRNVYALFDYGNVVKNSTTPQDSYVQFLSITEHAEAHGDFVTVRLGGIDTTGTRGLVSDSGFGGNKTIYYIVAGVIVAVFLCALVIFMILRARRRR